MQRADLCVSSLLSPLLQMAPRLTLWTSFKSARLKLWDEELQRMVGFPRRARGSA